MPGSGALRVPDRVESGHALISDRSGDGLGWNEEAVRHALAE